MSQEKITHIVFGWIIATIIVSCLCYLKIKEREAKNERDAELEERMKIRHKEDDEFNSDFAEIVELAKKREKAVYKIIIEKDRKIVSWIQDAIEGKKEKSSRRKRLESEFLDMFQDEIRECEKKLGRIEDLDENPDSWSNKAIHYKGAMLKIDCNCPNNENY